MDATHPDVAEVARRFRAGGASGDVLTDAVVEATLYCFRGDEPGFMAFGEPGSGFVPMYSSPETLVHVEGDECPWFAAKGGDLLRLVPEGYGVVLDPGAESEICLAAWAIRRDVVTS